MLKAIVFFVGAIALGRLVWMGLKRQGPGTPPDDS